MKSVASLLAKGLHIVRTSSDSKIHPVNYDEVEWVKRINGKTTYEGYMKDEKKHGEGTYIDRNAHVEYNGEWQDDNIHGKGKIHNYFEHWGFVGEFKDNEMVYGVMFWEGDTTYTGYFENNKMNGIGTIKWSNKSIYEGEFRDGKMHGYGVYTDPKGDIYEGDFENNKMKNTSKIR